MLSSASSGSRAAMPDQRWTDRVVVADEEYVVVRPARAPGQRGRSGDLRHPRRRLEKLRAWFAPADGEDALWLWLPRCFW